MFFLAKIGCRIFQAAFHAALPILPYREPHVVDSCAKLGEVLRQNGCHSVLVVTDSGIVSHGLTAPLEQALKKSRLSYVIYDKTQPNPTVDNVEEALTLYRVYNCDTLIAIGGGSSIDCAKAIGARVVYPKRSLYQLKGILRVWRRLPILVAIPTTAGTGSETTLAAIVTDTQKHHKYALMSFPLIPHFAVLDASLTVSLPPQLTATTGMDALTHAVEAYIGRSTSKETRRLALEAVSLIYKNIRTAYGDSNDLQARKAMLDAAYKAGIAFTKSYVGYVHAVAHSLGGRYGTPHGLANAVILPYVLESYGACIHQKLHRLGIAAGVCTEQDSHKDGAKKFIRSIWELNKQLGIPKTIDGILPEDIPAMSLHAAKEANPLYPVPKLMTQKELETYYYQTGGIHENT